jgi:His-Xaa-Ser system radical SAM maturase HxsB
VNSRPVFHGPATFTSDSERPYELLPFRFARLASGQGTVLVTSEVGEYAFLADQQFRDFVGRRLRAGDNLYRDLRSRHFLVESGADPHLDLIAAQYRTRKSFLRWGPSLHIFVVTLRCDHSCLYCQVSRRSPDAARFDMSTDTIGHAVARLFESRSPTITVEFQGGEPALAFGRVESLVQMIEERNVSERRSIRFTLASTLHALTEGMLQFCREHNICLSTSLDGPAFIHNANRPNAAHNSYERTVEAINRARSIVGTENVSALTTLTRLSLKHPKEIIDTYVSLGFRSIFLRPLSPYGFALRSARKTGYPMSDFVSFYRTALDYLIELNKKGVTIDEAYSTVLLNHILTPFPTGYMDLRSPAGTGLGTLVYNYDGRVYASDEGRMVAETGDDRFVLGTVDQPYRTLMTSEAMQWLLASGVAESLPGCSDCAFVPYCGSDPVYHASRQGDPVGHRPTSDFCGKHMGLFEVLFGRLARRDPDVMRVFLAWISRLTPAQVSRAGYMP